MATNMMDVGVTVVGAGIDATVTGGDFSIVESTAIHQTNIILDNATEYKQNPTVGVGAFLYLMGEGWNNLAGAISGQFAGDGMDVKYVKVGASGAISSDAFYP